MSKLFRNLSLRTKIIAGVLAISLIVIFAISIYSHFLYQDALEKESIGRLLITSKKSAGDIERIFEEATSMTNILSHTFGQMVKLQNTDRKLVGDILREETHKQNEYTSIWTLWEQNAFDDKDSEFIDDMSAYSDESGRFAPVFYRSNNQIKYALIKDDELESDFYKVSKQTRKGVVREPLDYVYGNELKPVRVLSVTTPIMLNGQFLGVIGVDLPLRLLEKSLHETKLFPGSSVQLISSSGTIILHPDTAYYNKSFVLHGSTRDILADIRSGKEQIFKIDIQGVPSYCTFVPVKVENSSAPWSLCVIVPEKDLLAESILIIKKTSFLFFPSLILLLICVIVLINNIIRPIVGANKVLTQLSLGHISQAGQLPVKNNDEIGIMSQSLNSLTIGLREMLNFAEEIGKRNYAVKYHLLSDNDELGHEMVEMRNNLSESAGKEELFKQEDERRSWVNHGLAEFSEILRNNNHDLEKLSYQMISRLVKYLNASQGGLFVVNNEDASHLFLELNASYAYERRKYLKKNIEVGEGLIGTCYQEGETIYMDDLPDGYIQITSGIGKANPRNLVIIPLKINDIIYGIMEIASFHNIEPYQIDFLEKVGANTASAISTVKANQHTNTLLEQSQLQAQRLSEQEEEMRQNLEEMQATQEEMSRKNEESEQAKQNLSKLLSEMQTVKDTLENETVEMQSVMDAVDKVFMRITYDNDMILLDINDTCLEFHGTTREQMIGIKLTDKMNPADIPGFEANWATVLAGGTFKGDGVRKTRNGDKHVWYMYCPIRNSAGKVCKVLMLGRFLEDM